MRGERVIENGFQPRSQAESIDKAVTPRAMTAKWIGDNAKPKQTAERVRQHCDYWIGQRHGLFYVKTRDGRYRRKPGRPQPGRP
jgi:hypothetical protein